MQNQHLLKAIQLVVSETQRLNDLVKHDKSAWDEYELFSEGMPSEHVEFPKKPSRRYFCGKEAESVLYEAVLLSLETDTRITDKVSASTLMKTIQVEIVQSCIEKPLPVTAQLVRQIYSRARTEALKELVDREYFFPAFTIRVEGDDEFSVGPVWFIPATKFFDQRKDEWQRSVTQTIEKVRNVYGSVQTDRIGWLYSTAKRYYCGFPSIASVHVPKAALELGHMAAKRLVESAFNVLRLFVESRQGWFIGLAEDAPFATSESKMDRDINGHFTVRHSYRGGEPYVSPDYIGKMRERMPQLRFIETILMKQRSWYPLRPIEQRLMSGLGWYGEAWKERVPLTKLVKFAVALETLVMTGHKEAITETIAERIALLCGSDVKEREELYTEAREVYSMRSKVVHGSQHKAASDLHRINAIAEKLSMFALVQCSALFPALAGRDKDALAEFFKVAKLAGLDEAAARFGLKMSPAGPPAAN